MVFDPISYKKARDVEASLEMVNQELVGAATKEDLEIVENQMVQISTPINAYANLKSAIESTSNSDLLFPSGIYNINTPIKASLSGGRKWVSSGRVVFNFTGETNGTVLDVELNGNDLSIEGDFELEGNNKARQGLQLTNNAPSMESAANLKINKFKVKNIYSSSVGQSSTGINIRGAFQLINLITPSIKNISRAIGVGTPGSQGSDGITVSHYGIRAYARLTIIDNPTIDTITSGEIDDTPDNVDCDGIKVFAPTVEGVVVPDAVAFINGGTYKDCRGRSIKSQMSYTHVDRPTFIRKDVRSITNGSEVDFQYGDGRVTKLNSHYSLMDNGDSPLGASFKLVTATANKIDAFLDVKDGVIFSNFPIPYLVTVSTSPLKEFAHINISGNKVLGEGRIGSALRGQLNRARNVNIEDNYFNALTSTLIDSMDSNGNVYNVSNNTNKGGDLIPIARAATGGAPRINGSGNVGFDDRMSVMGGDTATQVVRTDTIMTRAGVTTGLFGMESTVIANESTHEFSMRGGGIGLYLLATNFNENAQVLFSASSSNTMSLINNENLVVAFGSTSNPDESGKLNIWVSGGKIMVMNKLGSNRSVTLVSIT